MRPLIALAAVLAVADAAGADAPSGSRYFELLSEIAANPSREAALTEQESSWRVRAQSPYAKGLRQFTDSTGKWAARTFCRDLGPYKPFDAEWSLRCGVRYAERLQGSDEDEGYCHNRRWAEQSYNGGASWVRWEMDAAGHDWDRAEAMCGVERLPNGRKRSKSSCHENYTYPKRITERQRRLYMWVLPGEVCH